MEAGQVWELYPFKPKPTRGEEDAEEKE